MIETAVLTFALTMVPSPPQQSAKALRSRYQRLQRYRRTSFADFAKGVLKCYHPTARYQSAAIEKRPWPDQKKYGAKGSALVSIQYVGVSNANYTLAVGVLAKPGAIKTVIQSDTAKVHAYENCELGDWVEVK